MLTYSVNSLKHLRCAFQRTGLRKTVIELKVFRRTCATDTQEHSCDVSKEKGKIRTRLKNAPDNKTCEERVLDFFNNCDDVTLKQLKNLKPSALSGVEPYEIVQHGTKECRFKEFGDLEKKTGFTQADVVNIDRLISRLKNAEFSKFEIRKLKPDLKMSVENAMKIHQVTVLDVFQQNIAWCIQTIHSREVLSYGYKKLFGNNFKYTYNHSKHYHEVCSVLHDLPESEVFLLYTYDTSKKKPIGPKQVKFYTHQRIMEAVVTTLLNSKTLGVFGERIDDPTEHEPQLNYREMVFKNVYNQTPIKGKPSEEGQEQQVEKYVFPSFVYQFDSQTLGQFYDVLIQGELQSCSQFIEKWYGVQNGPLDKLYLERETLKNLANREQLAKCILMSDIFSRSLSKFSKSFPKAYT